MLTMRLSTAALLFAAASALATTSANAAVAPLRASASLPATSHANLAGMRRASTPVTDESALVGFPIYIFAALITVVVVVVAVSTGGGRSPG